MHLMASCGFPCYFMFSCVLDSLCLFEPSSFYSLFCFVCVTVFSWCTCEYSSFSKGGLARVDRLLIKKQRLKVIMIRINH